MRPDYCPFTQILTLLLTVRWAAAADAIVEPTWSAKSSTEIALSLRNPGVQPAAFPIAAGTVLSASSGGARWVVLRAQTVQIPAGGTLDVTLPAARLNRQALAADRKLALNPDPAPNLAPLLKHLAAQPDFPRATAQLVVLCLTENIDFTAWQQFLATNPTSTATTGPTPQEIVQAIDALGVLRSLFPERPFALASDEDLKRRALRNPWCRAKAMQLYGLSVPELATELPDIGQLLHKKPGDNCPVCRLRDQMQKGASDF